MHLSVLATGIILISALFLGRMFARLKLPKVTGYLFAGLLWGTSLAHILNFTPVFSRVSLANLEFINQFGLVVIMFSVGGYFKMPMLRRFGFKLLVVSFSESFITSFAVFAGVFLLGMPLLSALLLGIMAMSTAPGATQMVMREYQSEGKLTDSVMMLIGLNNFSGILIFVLVYDLFVVNNGLQLLVTHLLYPVIAGFTAAIWMTYWEQRIDKTKERQVMIIGVLLILVASAVYFKFNILYAGLVAGIITVNASPFEDRLINEMKELDYPIYVMFFALAGTHLKLESVPKVGIYGIAYIVLRFAGKWIGNYLGSLIVKSKAVIRKNLGFGMMCQAGIAIGLASMLVNNWNDPQAYEIQSIILASVIFFEIVGPILTREALVKSGEVTVLSMLMGKSPVGLFESFQNMMNTFASALGIKSSSLKDPHDIPIKMVMRRHLETISENMTFDHILKALGHSRYDRLPVVSADNKFVGIVQYSDIASVLYTEELRKLVVAKDIAVEPIARITEDAPLSEALKVFRDYPQVSYLFVVDKEDPDKLAGVVRHNDVLSFHHMF